MVHKIMEKYGRTLTAVDRHSEVNSRKTSAKSEALLDELDRVAKHPWYRPRPEAQPGLANQAQHDCHRGCTIDGCKERRLRVGDRRR